MGHGEGLVTGRGLGHRLEVRVCQERGGCISKGGGRSEAPAGGSHLHLGLADTCASPSSRWSRPGSHQAVGGRA